LPHEGAIVVGVDDSAASLHALPVAFEEASARHAPLVVLEAAADACAPGPTRELALWRTKFSDVDVLVSNLHGRVQAALANASRTATMLVLGSYDHNAMPGLRVGRRLVHQAFCPILIVGEHTPR
jgi:nucleotide-binding universal stress UspA family protein